MERVYTLDPVLGGRLLAAGIIQDEKNSVTATYAA